MNDICIAGAAILDVLVRPVNEAIFRSGSHPVEAIRLSTGGDAMNESTVLARLGHRPALITVLGTDDAAALIRARCAENGVTPVAVSDPNVATGINTVLVDEHGERSFLTDPKGTLRRLSKRDLLSALETEAFRGAAGFCLASMFVSSELSIPDMAEVFARVRAAGKLLCSDTTRPKHGETAADAAPALSQLDWFLANRDEAARLTGETDPERAARRLLDAGTRGTVIKLGGDGCLLATADHMRRMPAVPGIRCVDTTGAGDTFSAAFQASLLEGRSPIESCAYANAAAAQCVEQLGACTGTLDRDRLERDAQRLLR